MDAKSISPKMPVKMAGEEHDMNERMPNGNVRVRDGYDLVCCWPGTTLDAGQADDFEAWAQETFAVQVQYLENVETTAGCGGPGGRSDMFFAVKGEVGVLAIKRLAYGIRWLEDALDGGWGALWPERIRQYAKGYVPPAEPDERDALADLW